MQFLRTFPNLGRNDARLIGRDSFLSGMFIYVLGIAIFSRLALPWINDQVYLQSEGSAAAEPLYPLFVGYIVIYLGALLASLAMSFITLDERDDQTIKALMVTPMPMSHYLAYRLIIVAILAFIVILVEALIVNVALIPLWQMVIIAAAGSLTAPMAMLFLSTFAQNKVQGFALIKIVNAGGLLIVGAWFVNEPLEYLAGFFPPYWFAKAYWVAYAGGDNWWLALIIGVILSLAAIAYLLRRFQKVIHE